MTVAIVRVLAVSLLVLLLAGCSALNDDPAIGLCRAVAPAVARISANDVRRVRVLSTESRRIDGAILVVVNFTIDGGERSTINCMIERAGGSGRLELIGVSTNDGPLGDVKLHLLRRFWIENGLAALHDPQPIAVASFAPDLPRGVAIGVQHIVGAVPAVSIYMLLAAAYALIYGLIGRIHLAFGELAMLAGYGGFLGFVAAGAASASGWAILAALLVAIYAAVIQGDAVARYVLVPLSARPERTLLIATIGLSIVWSEAVRLLQGTGNQWIEPLFARPIGIARADDLIVVLTPAAMICAPVAGVIVWLLIERFWKARIGRRWRAVSDDPVAAQMLGVNIAATLRITSIVASMLVAIAGLLSLAVYGGVGHGSGMAVSLKALIAAVVGGVGSVRGAVFGAALIGLFEVAWSIALPLDYRDAALFGLLVAFLILRPHGLWGTEQQSTEKSV